MVNTPPMDVIADALKGVPPEEHADRLREIIAYAAAAIVFTAGPKHASEACYIVGDAVIGAGR